MRIEATFLLTTLLFLNACTDESTPLAPDDVVRPAKIFVVQNSDAVFLRVFPGTVEAAHKSGLSFRVGGQLKTLIAVPGKNFEKGQVLAQLDQSEYLNVLADRQAKFDLAESQYKKIQRLFEKRYVSPSEVDQANANLQAAKAALLSAKDNVEYTDIVAPFDGVVALVNVENFQSVQANQPIIQYHNSDTLHIRYSVPESLLGNVKRVEDPSGICAQVRFNAHPAETYKACFKEFESVPDQLTRSYSVVHSMQQLEQFRVLPGMAVTVELDLTGMLLETESKALLVPIEAVFQRDGQARVWKVKDDGAVTAVPVETDVVSNGSIFVSRGVEPGDAIVAAGINHLYEGLKVKAMAKERGL